ncbi:amidase [uncultured Nocardioides sp.]|uniref:amidase n=1 Tax=uncultured Nocardioides sp. TaxID=198441 RepID=UPI002616BF3A|nr:amidase [uncultured Nocardioides sp.]
MTRTRVTRGLSAAAVAALVTGGLYAAAPAQAISTVTADNGATWNVNDARRPGLDTGSVRNVSQSRMEAFGSLFLSVAEPDDTDAPRMDDQMLRGFGLTPTGGGGYASTNAVRLGDVAVTRRLEIDAASGAALFFDTFTSVATEPQDVEVSFGGTLGYGTGANQGVVRDSGDGDAEIDTDDDWAVAAPDGQLRATGIVLGSPNGERVDRVGDQQDDPFEDAYSTTGSDSNDPGFVRSLALEPGETRSLAHFVVVGATGATQQTVDATEALAATPDFSDLSLDERCTLANWDLTEVPGVDATACAGAEPLQLPAAQVDADATTDVAYDVVGKTIDELSADLADGSVTSVQLTQAYLDRIAAYDDGPFGFNAFITVADNALDQARAADAARADGEDSPLLGVPLSIKDNYDTLDMPTTNGTRALADWRPTTDAFQVAALRRAGAVIIGKTTLSEFANSGSFSESGFKQAWNGLYPSKTSFGSSGGSATSVAASMAAGSMGSQTGVSLYAPTTGAGLTTFRGTDGLTSTGGILPLTWASDFGGPIARSVTDLAHLLDATATRTTGNNPDDLLTSRVDNDLRPEAFSPSLDADALEGKTIGFLPASFASTSVADDTAGPVALAQAREALTAAGATVVEMTGSATNPPNTSQGSASVEGWERYIAEHPTFPFADRNGILGSPQNLPYNVSQPSSATGLDDANTETFLARRDTYKENVASWMDDNGVDAVIYPGFLTSMGNNDASSAVLSSDRGTGVLTSAAGMPTVVVPIGANDDGQSNAIQILGRAWTDADVVGMGYALEQQAQAAPLSEYAPALPWSGPAESVTSLTLGTTATRYGTGVPATVSVAADPEATGAVSVEVDGKTVEGTLAGGSVDVVLPDDISVGTHVVTASYAGSSSVAPSGATAQVKVSRARPTVTARLPKSTVKAGTRAPIVLGLDAPSAGQVTVLRGNRVLLTRTVPAGGQVRVQLPELGAGTYALRARVLPNATLTASSSDTVRLRVRR